MADRKRWVTTCPRGIADPICQTLRQTSLGCVHDASAGWKSVRRRWRLTARYALSTPQSLVPFSPIVSFPCRFSGKMLFDHGVEFLAVRSVRNLGAGNSGRRNVPGRSSRHISASRSSPWARRTAGKPARSGRASIAAVLQRRVGRNRLARRAAWTCWNSHGLERRRRAIITPSTA